MTFRSAARFTTSVSVLAFAIMAMPAFAADEVVDNGEIVVTAQKRSQNLSDVPAAIQAITGDTLERRGTRSLSQLVDFIPGASIVSKSAPGFETIQIRGISSGTVGDATVGYYIDDVVFSIPNLQLAPPSRLLDLERTEVLRGPQGTLYGKNTTGGAVNLISRAPKLGETSGYLNLGYGNYNRIDANGAINLPLGDKLALRVAGTYSTADGWFKNVIPGKPDLASVNEYGIRAALRFEPSDGIDITLRGSTSYQNPRN